MFPRRAGPARAHPQAQGVQAPKDTHLFLLWQVLHPGDLLGQAHAEARGPVWQAASDSGLRHHQPTPGHGSAGQPREPGGRALLAQDGRLRLQSPADGPETERWPPGLRSSRPPPWQPPEPHDRGRAARSPGRCVGGAPRPTLSLGPGWSQPILGDQDELRLLAAPVEHAPVPSRVPWDAQPQELPRLLRPHLLPPASIESKLRRALF